MWMFYSPLKTELVRERLQKAAPRTMDGKYATKSNDSGIDYKGIDRLDLSDLLCDPEDNLKDGRPAEAQNGGHIA